MDGIGHQLGLVLPASVNSGFADVSSEGHGFNGDVLVADLAEEFDSRLFNSGVPGLVARASNTSRNAHHLPAPLFDTEPYRIVIGGTNRSEKPWGKTFDFCPVCTDNVRNEGGVTWLRPQQNDARCA